MNKQLEDKKKELKAIDKIITEALIISQEKYLDYLDAQEKLKTEIKLLEESKDKPVRIKSWVDIEGGWKQRTYKNE